jgi:hypothetical protein
MKYNLAKELTATASQILLKMTQKVFGGILQTARKFSPRRGQN